MTQQSSSISFCASNTDERWKGFEAFWLEARCDLADKDDDDYWREIEGFEKEYEFCVYNCAYVMRTSHRYFPEETMDYIARGRPKWN